MAMEQHIQGIGKKASSMGKESSSSPMEMSMRDCGSVEE